MYQLFSHIFLGINITKHLYFIYQSYSLNNPCTVDLVNFQMLAAIIVDHVYVVRDNGEDDGQPGNYHSLWVSLCLLYFTFYVYPMQ